MAWQARCPADDEQCQRGARPGHARGSFNVVALRRTGPLACGLAKWARGALVAARACGADAGRMLTKGLADQCA
eukprot:gene270-10270_t